VKAAQTLQALLAAIISNTETQETFLHGDSNNILRNKLDPLSDCAATTALNAYQITGCLAGGLGYCAETSHCRLAGRTISGKAQQMEKITRGDAYSLVIT
jgi:hypothetical protein